MLPDEGQDLLPADVRQHQVQQDQVVAGLPEAAQRLPAAAGRVQLAALAGQQLPQALAHAGLVVHDQYAAAALFGQISLVLAHLALNGHCR